MVHLAYLRIYLYLKYVYILIKIDKKKKLTKSNFINSSTIELMKHKTELVYSEKNVYLESK